MTALPDPPGFGPPRPSRRTTATVLAAVGLILLFRRPDQLLRPQFWAEDGIIFFWQSWRLGGARALIEPYSGYLHLVPRLFAWAGNALPVLWRPAFYNWGAWTVTLAVAALICRYVRLEGVARPETRVGFAIALALAPHGGEVFLTQAALQWILAPLQILLILQRPARGRGELWTDCLLLAVAGLTGPMAILLLPLLAARVVLYGPPSRSGWAAPGTVAVAALAQGWSVWHSERLAVPPLARDAQNWLRAAGFELPGRLFFGDQLPELLGGAFWVLTPALAAAFFLLWLAAREPRRRWFALALLATAAIFWAAGVRIFADHPERMQPLRSGMRYFYVPYVLAIWTLLLLRETSGARLWPRRTAEALLALVLLASATRFTWPREPDYNWAETARRLERGERTLVRQPGPVPGGWYYEVEPVPAR